MKVLFDSRTFSEQTFGGISRYFVQLINHLPQDISSRISLIASENSYLHVLKNRPHTFSLRGVPEHRKLYYFINGLVDNRFLRKGDYDLFHPTGFSPYFIDRVKSPVVVTVHDMIYHHGFNPGKHAADIMENMRRTTLAATRIIAISEATKQSILQFYDVDPDIIDVIHHGYQPVASNLSPLCYCPERYILFVGHRGGYKNFATLLNAFSLIAAKEPDLYLVCTGRSFNHEERDRIAKLGLSERIICRFIPEQDMQALYANARCFIFPSKMEGFGMPILEAFAAETPVILSDASCFPEIAGNAGIYFNPDDPDMLAAHISKTINDPEFASSKIIAGKQELKRFSWQKTASLTAETYHKALESHL